MNALIKITAEESSPKVSARELHAKLEIKDAFTTWFYTQCRRLGYLAETDFVGSTQESTGGRPSVDYQIPLDVAKHMCMLSGSPKAHEIRQHFIEVEKAWNEPSLVMARALKWADQQITLYQGQIAEMKPKAEFYDTVTGSRTAIPFDQAAKVLGYRNMGRNNLFAFLRDKEILMDNNQPYQAYIDRGYFRVVETKFTKPNGDIGINVKTLIYQKGLDYVRKLLDKAGHRMSNVALVR